MRVVYPEPCFTEKSCIDVAHQPGLLADLTMENNAGVQASIHAKAPDATRRKLRLPLYSIPPRHLETPAGTAQKYNFPGKAGLEVSEDSLWSCTGADLFNTF